MQEISHGDLSATLQSINKFLTVKDGENVNVYLGNDFVAFVDDTTYRYEFAANINHLKLTDKERILIHDLIIDYVCQFTKGRDIHLQVDEYGVVAGAYRPSVTQQLATLANQ